VCADPGARTPIGPVEIIHAGTGMTLGLDQHIGIGIGHIGFSQISAKLKYKYINIGITRRYVYANRSISA
jgi:hypothetical protein